MLRRRRRRVSSSSSSSSSSRRRRRRQRRRREGGSGELGSRLGHPTAQVGLLVAAGHGRSGCAASIIQESV